MHHFQEITQAPNTFNGTNSLVRIIDGAGFRYYWATENLSEEDLQFSPGNEGRNLLQTLAHLDYMASFVCNTLEGKVTSFPEQENGLSFEKLRKTTLHKLDRIKNLLSQCSDEDFQSKKIKCSVQGNAMEFDIWNMIHGPLVDIIYHLGQVVSFRRSSGNPIDPGVQPFMGKRMEIA
ncbi:MAG: DinB family protein [Bacteroidia bacterium]|nr:DinB family protein [Bacteroidia bacterium]